jgi:hypothetical protein
MSNAKPLLEGSWNEILSRKDDIPGALRVKVFPDSAPSEAGDKKRLRLQRMAERFLEGVGRIAAKEGRPPEEIGEELIREARFPGIEFRSLYGERVAFVKDGMQVWQIIWAARNYEEETAARTAEHVVLSTDKVRIALEYYAAYPEEIDAILDENDKGYERLKRIHPQMHRYSLTNEDLASVPPDDRIS